MAATPEPGAVPPIEPAPAAGPPAASSATPPPPPPPVPVPPPPAAGAPRVDPYAATTPYPAPAPYAPGQTAYYAQAPYNTLAIVGFVLAFFVSLAAIVCGHIALSQIKRTGERGHGLALAAVIIGYAGVAFWLLYIVFIVVFVVATASTTSY